MIAGIRNIRNVFASQRHRLENWTLLAILLLAVVLRWKYLILALPMSLERDAVGVMEIAASMRHPFDTTYREPLWIWLVKLPSLAFGPSPFHLRLLSLVLSVAFVYCSFRLIRDYTGSNGLALLSALFLATNEYLVLFSVRGLRNELYTITLVPLQLLLPNNCAILVPERRNPYGPSQEHWLTPAAT